MAKQFALRIMAPDKLLFSGAAQKITVTCTDGELTVLPGHAPMLAAIDIGSITIDTGGETETAYHSEGILKVKDNTVTVFTEACEWAEDIDTARANIAKDKADAMLHQHQNKTEHVHSLVSLRRAVTRLNIAKHK